MEYQMAANDLVSLIKTVADEFTVQANEKAIQLRLESDDAAVLPDAIATGLFRSGICTRTLSSSHRPAAKS
jgi:hypothetical protein